MALKEKEETVMSPGLETTKLNKRHGDKTLNL